MTGLIDTHVHLDYLDNCPQQVADALTLGIEHFVVPGTTIAQWPGLLTTVEAVPQALAAPGVHPMDAGQWLPEHTSALQQLLSHPRVVAIGEVGLDRRVNTPLPVQEAVLKQLVGLAVDASLPLLIHNRGATARLLAILRNEAAGKVGGIFHAFSGSLDIAKQAIDLGFALGIGGVITFPEARRLPQVVRQVPPDWLVVETDAPDLTPHPHRGEQNRPANLPLVAAALGKLRNWDMEETARITTANAQRVLKLAG